MFTFTSKIIGLAVAAITLTAAAPASAQQTPIPKPPVGVCTTPNGLWGSGNTVRVKIEKYADGTAAYLTQQYAAPDKNVWNKHPQFSALAGGEFTSISGGIKSLSGHIPRSWLRSSDLLPFYHQSPAACCGDFLLARDLTLQPVARMKRSASDVAPRQYPRGAARWSPLLASRPPAPGCRQEQIGRASCRERV